MKTSSKMLFLMMTLTSTIMILSSSNWMNMWISMEINLMSFIPLMSETKNPFMSESTMMYFLIQSMASSVFIMAILTSKFIFIYNTSNSEMNFIIMVSMLMKLGMPPFHLWFPEIMNKMKWNMCFMMSTWQKLGPLYILSKILEKNMMTMTIVTITAMTGAVMGINQTSTRKIMSYSSINHLSWLMLLTISFKELWTWYMLMYTALMAATCLILFNYNINYINQMKTFSTKILDKMIVTATMLSLGGLPPFLGFMPKLMAIQSMMNTNEMMIMLIMVVSTLITLSYYLKMSSSVNLMLSNSQKWMNLPELTKNTFIYMTIMNISFPAMLMLTTF